MHTLAQIYRRLQVSPAESRILQVLAAAANIHGYNARMAYEALAAATGFSERWVKELVARLEAKSLLRVKRAWLAPKRCAINVYQIVRPWLLELSYREVYHKKHSAQMSSERNLHPQNNTREKREPAAFCSHEECLTAGLTEGSIAYRAARGIPEPDTPTLTASKAEPLGGKG